ncbi:hypothetical protein SCWH03_30350 [Streptomyces pacificus]|uniref:Uncharacterized protein n=1 Tax=Streptomyces pacificus TaxID=2705029 RepID=A0A6A0AVD7_9ACTN|nr:hypothetical protein SCWH03_30350 [Streptomyces pacificus]
MPAVLPVRVVLRDAPAPGVRELLRALPARGVWRVWRVWRAWARCCLREYVGGGEDMAAHPVSVREAALPRGRRARRAILLSPPCRGEWISRGRPAP